MRLATGYDVSVSVSNTCLLVLLALLPGAKTLQIKATYSKPLMHKRLDVTPRDVITRSSAIHCAVTCRLTSWCVTANLLPDRRTCQLLTEEVPDDDESLLEDNGWKYLREYARFSRNPTPRTTCTTSMPRSEMFALPCISTGFLQPNSSSFADLFPNSLFAFCRRGRLFTPGVVL